MSLLALSAVGSGKDPLSDPTLFLKILIISKAAIHFPNLTPRMPTAPGAGPGQSQKLRMHSRAPLWVPETQVLEPFHLLAGSSSWKRNLRTEGGHSHIEYRCPGDLLR